MSESSPSNPELHDSAVAYRVGDDGGHLELPVNRDFLSLPPKLTPERYVAWCEERLKNPVSKVVSLPDEPLLPRSVFDF